MDPLQRHLGRWWLLAVALLAGPLLVTRSFKREDATHLRQLAQFASTYINECDGFGFDPPFPHAVRDAYLRSHRLQQVVAREMAALARGGPCDEVTRALHTADFPAALPMIRLQPDR